MGYYSQTLQDGRPYCTGLTLQVILTPPPLDNATNGYGFIFTSASLITTKLGKIIDHYALADDNYVITSRSSDKNPCHLLTPLFKLYKKPNLAGQ